MTENVQKQPANKSNSRDARQFRRTTAEHQPAAISSIYAIQEELKPGSYKVEIFNDGYFIGESSFALR